MDPREQLSAILPALGELVGRIEPWQLTDPTPCADFNVRDVLDHMIVLGGSFAYLFRGEEPIESKAPAVTGWVPVAEFRKVMDDLLDAVHTPGAMDRTIDAPVGQMPGSTFARFVAFDGAVHGWDLAAATGLGYELPPEVISTVDEFAREALGPDMRDGDTFKEAVVPPDSAGPMERLVAFSGRSV